MRKALRALGLAVTMAGASGCTTAHLNGITGDSIATVEGLQTQATLNNLARFIDDPHAIPSHVVIRSGTSQVVHEANPYVQFNLTPNVAGLASATLQAASSVQRSTTITWPGANGGLSGTIVELQNYSFTPVSDADALRNLQALYRHAVYGAALKGNFLLPVAQRAGRLYPNPAALQEPSCVLCATRQGVLTPSSASVYENRKLKPKWLAWDLAQEVADNPAAPYVSLGRYSGHALFMPKADYDAGVLSDFVLFAMSVAGARTVATPSVVSGGDANVTAGQSWPQATTYTPGSAQQ
ncbi:MAG: hypothetical protein KGM42_17420 [Hyphomicrobiales bacterium]|nr:hypothetical protein [Hyphomicrobiales bacterium]